MFLKTEKLEKHHFGYLYSCILFVYFIAFIVPAGAANSDILNNSCVDCHGALSPFSNEQSRLNEIRVLHTQKNISCSLECHEDVLRKRASDNYQQWSDSEHSRYYVTCDACHGGNPRVKTKAEAHATVRNVDDPESPIFFKNIPDTCGKCHTEEQDHFKNTMHYQRLKAEFRAPSCATCHQPHTFKVLKASELTVLCSVCHNQQDQIATAGIPKEAKQALERANEFKDELRKAKNSVAEAKAAGKEVSSAQTDLDNAQEVDENIPALWHGFNLKDFDRQIQSGIDSAKKAEYKTSSAEPTVPRIPGVEMILIFAIFAIIYLMRRR